MDVSVLYTTSSVPIIGHFVISKYIIFAMHLDIHYV